MKRIGNTELEVFPLALGGNTFGFTSDEAQSFAVLDAYAEAGGNFVDTADVYSAWAPGNSGGESEIILGRWLKLRKKRHKFVISTKVGQLDGFKGLSPRVIRRAVEASLRRLQTDVIDMYYAHIDDAETPLEVSLATFDELVREGKVRTIAASQYTAPRLAKALSISRRHGWAAYVALQTHYSLLHRQEFETELADLAVREGVMVLPFWSLANGFLTGKYRPGIAVESVRADRASAHLDARGLRVLAALDAVALSQESSVAAVALAWVAAQPGVGALLASARTPEQLREILPANQLVLSAEELRALSAASA